MNIIFNKCILLNFVIFKLFKKIFIKFYIIFVFTNIFVKISKDFGKNVKVKKRAKEIQTVRFF